LVLFIWLFIGAFAVINGPKLSEVQQNDSSTFLPKTAESTLVINEEVTFRDDDIVPAVIVYERTSGITAADRAEAARDRAEIAELEGIVEPVLPVVPSEDGQALQLTVLLDSNGSFRELPAKVADIRAIAATEDGLTVKVGGVAGSSGDFVEAFGDLDTRVLLFTVLVVVIILLITYRSPFLWFLPLITVLLADYLAQGVNYFLASNDIVVVNGQTASILLILVFGAGTDYALLLISRYREELRRHEDRHEAMAEALLRSSGAIAASAMTVAIGLMMLVFSTLESTRGLGPVTAIGILCALFAVLTLLPALLVAAGRWVFWPFVPRFGSESHEVSGVWSRVGQGVSKKPRAVWVVTALALAAVGLGATTLDTGGIAARDQFRTTVGSVEAQTIITAHFDDGQGTPAIIIGPAADADEIVETASNVPGVASVGAPVERDGLVRIEATLDDAPDSDAAAATIDQLRASLDDVGTDVLVGGRVAVELDGKNAAASDRGVVIPLVLIVIMIILMLLLRAVTVSLVLVGTVILSFFATLGLCALLFNSLLGFTNVDPNYTLFAFIFLVALGVDYNIFLMTRVREESVRLGTHEGMLRGLAVTGGVITSAGVVLAATFAVLATLPITPLFQIGVTVAIGVLLDTIIVRSVLVPAITLDLGRRIWWPSQLWRTDGGAQNIDVTDSDIPAEPEPPAVVGR
jgi:RND superfamily putative drug exporter